MRMTHLFLLGLAGGTGGGLSFVQPSRIVTFGEDSVTICRIVGVSFSRTCAQPIEGMSRAVHSVTDTKHAAHVHASYQS
jgi:hypothetical protein